MDYYIYGLNISSSIPIQYVDECKNSSGSFLHVECNCDNNLVDSPICIREDSHKIHIDLAPFAKYAIDFYKKDILCRACDYEAFYSTFFNIPLSSYIIFEGDILLHASAMLLNEGLICFTGEKGIGKSTLTNLLNGSKLKQFSDDTLKIDSQLNGFKGNNLTKLTQESVECLSTKRLTGHSNAVGKQYALLDTDFLPRKVKAIIYMQRGGSGICIKKIKSKIAQRTVIFNNIVGINYFTPGMIKKALRIVKDIDIPIYVLEVPNNLHQLLIMKEKLINLIIKEVI